MQSLMYIRSGKAVIQGKTETYTDTYENFLLDGGDPLPDGLEEVDFNLTLHNCISKGECSDQVVHEYAEKQIGKVHELAAAFAARKAIFDKEYEKQRFEMHEREAAEAAAKAEKEHWDNLTLDAYKKERLVELDQVSSRFEDNLNKDMYFISSNGFKCNGDRRTKSNIQDIITFFDLQANDGRVMYRDYDNVERSLNKAQVQTLLIEHVANGNALYSQKWTLQEKIRAAKTKDALKKLKLDFVMSDFNKQPVSI